LDARLPYFWILVDGNYKYRDTMTFHAGSTFDMYLSITNNDPNFQCFIVFWRHAYY